MADLAERVIEFKSCTVIVCWTHVITYFREDESFSDFWPPISKASFIGAAHEMGYLSVMQYGIEHDIMHALIAEECGWPHSWSVWSAAHGTTGPERSPDEWSQRVRDEEHLVNRMQAYINTGKLDGFGNLFGTFGDRLPDVACKFIKVLRLGDTP